MLDVYKRQAIDSILYGAGEFVLHDSIVNYGVMGVELVATLGTGLEFVDPLQVLSLIHI